jgi:hypothetical protein
MAKLSAYGGTVSFRAVYESAIPPEGGRITIAVTHTGMTVRVLRKYQEREEGRLLPGAYKVAETHRLREGVITGLRDKFVAAGYVIENGV